MEAVAECVVVGGMGARPICDVSTKNVERVG